MRHKAVAYETKQTAPRDIDEYIASFSFDVQKILQKIRKTISKAAPGAVEAIAYQIPTFRLGGKNLIHFAAFQKHIGVYPAPREAAEFKTELTAYQGGKGTVQFPLDKPIPYDLIVRILKFNVERNLEKAAATRKK